MPLMVIIIATVLGMLFAPEFLKVWSIAAVVVCGILIIARIIFTVVDAKRAQMIGGTDRYE